MSSLRLGVANTSGGGNGLGKGGGFEAEELLIHDLEGISGRVECS